MKREIKLTIVVWKADRSQEDRQCVLYYLNTSSRLTFIFTTIISVVTWSYKKQHFLKHWLLASDFVNYFLQKATRLQFHLMACWKLVIRELVQIVFFVRFSLKPVAYFQREGQDDNNQLTENNIRAISNGGKSVCSDVIYKMQWPIIERIRIIYMHFSVSYCLF